MVYSSKSKLLRYAHLILVSLGSAEEISKIFDFEIPVVRSWFRHPLSIPVCVAFLLFDYSGSQLVVFPHVK